jgi:hypothetical protein
MYQEKIAQLTADHLRTHIDELLAEVNAQFPDNDIIKLVTPKKIEVAGQVGGVVNELPENLPHYAVDCLSKTFGGVREDLWTFQYDGHFAGMVAATNQTAVDKLAKRHASAVELFLRRHWHLHLHSDEDFTLMQMIFMGSDFSGAEPVGEVNGRELWLGAFRIDVAWSTSEDGPSD